MDVPILRTPVRYQSKRACGHSPQHGCYCVTQFLTRFLASSLSPKPPLDFALEYVEISSNSSWSTLVPVWIRWASQLCMKITEGNHTDRLLLFCHVQRNGRMKSNLVWLCGWELVEQFKTVKSQLIMIGSSKLKWKRKMSTLTCWFRIAVEENLNMSGVVDQCCESPLLLRERT